MSPLRHLSTPWLVLLDVFLDNISLGEWTTPVITQVDPGKITIDWTGQVVAVHGENFIDPVTLMIGDRVITGVVWIDEHTLQVTLPEDMLPGTYSVTVTNPGGQIGTNPSAIWLGLQQLLPMIRR